MYTFGCQLKRIGGDISEKFNLRPGTFSVELHIRGKRVIKASCMAHSRRMLFELYAAGKRSHIAQAAVAQFNVIYAVEAELHDTPPVERVHRLHTDIKPLMDKLRHWLLDDKIKVPDGTGTIKANYYSF